MDHFFDRKRMFLEQAEILEPTARTERFINEALETGGTYTPKRPGDDWASHMVEIDLHDVHATGENDDEAQRNWMRIAARTPSPCAAPADMATA